MCYVATRSSLSGPGLLIAILFAAGAPALLADTPQKATRETMTWAVSIPFSLSDLPPYRPTQQGGATVTVRFPVRVHGPLTKADVRVNVVPVTSNRRFLPWDLAQSGQVFKAALYNPQSGFHELYLPMAYYECHGIGVTYRVEGNVHYFLRSRLLPWGGALLIPRIATRGTYVTPGITLVPALALSGRWRDERLVLHSTTEKSAAFYVFQLVTIPVPAGSSVPRQIPGAMRVVRGCIWDKQVVAPHVSIAWPDVLSQGAWDFLRYIASPKDVENIKDAQTRPMYTFSGFRKGVRYLALYARSEAWDANQRLVNASPLTYVGRIDAEHLRGARFHVMERPERRKEGGEPRKENASHRTTMAANGRAPCASREVATRPGDQVVCLHLKCPDNLPREHIRIKLWAHNYWMPGCDSPYVFHYVPQSDAYCSIMPTGTYSGGGLQVVSDVELKHPYFARCRLTRPQTFVIRRLEGKQVDLGEVQYVRGLEVDHNVEGRSGDIAIAIRQTTSAASCYTYALWLVPWLARPGRGRAPEEGDDSLIAQELLLCQERTTARQVTFSGQQIRERLRSGWTNGAVFVNVKPLYKIVGDTWKVRVTGLRQDYSLYLYAGVEAWDKNDNLINASPVYMVRKLPRDVLNGVEMEQYISPDLPPWQASSEPTP